MSQRCVMIMAGGTGGHVFPGLAVARQLASAGQRIVWLGTRHGMEAKIVPAAGIPVEWVSVGGLRGKGWSTWVLAPVRLLKALWQSIAAIRRQQPEVVLGLGGFVSGPGGLAAWLLRRPLLIHEQNAVAGLTNRVLARVATEVFEAFPCSFPPSRRAITIGNPIRPEIAELAPPEQRLAGREGPVRILVLGGSQGALALNRLLPAALAMLKQRCEFEILHQAGERTMDTARAAYREAGIPARIVSFVDDMAAAYAWADIAVCRSGALTVGELAAAGIASILVPFPAAVDDHQSANARYLSDAGAALLMQEADIDAASLADAIEPLLSERSKLLDMALAARALAMPEALPRLSEACLTVRGGR